MKLTLEEILRACEGELVKGVKDETAYTFSTDTRSIKHGDIYIPLKGAKFDGENFIDKAVQAGASGCLTTKSDAHSPIIIKVADTLKAYLDICGFYLEKQNVVIVGITGSSGKTTTKEMLYSVLSEKFRTHKTFSNHNNEIGFCETMFNMPIDSEVVSYERGRILGMNTREEIFQFFVWILYGYRITPILKRDTCTVSEDDVKSIVSAWVLIYQNT